MSSPGAAKASPSVFPGATISGRFRVERLLGRGAMGSVWLARHLSLDVDVAVKFIDAAFRHESDHRGRFELEAQAAARINSPHVVSVLDFGDDDGRQYIAMEYLEGEDLASLLERSKRLSVKLTGRIVRHACRGLGKAHGLGIAHRDIKPENLFLCGAGDDDGFLLKILDFGVAKTTTQAASFTGTGVGQLIGSPAFMSPEQARGLPNIDGRSDLFSLAVVVYHCLTGIMPFRGDSIPDLLFAILGAAPEPVSKLVPGLSRGLDAWFERALDKDPLRRFASAKDMALAFELAVGEQAAWSSEQTRSAQVAARDHESTLVTEDSLVEVISSIAPRPSVPSIVSASNDTPESGVAAALAQLGDLNGVLGVGLVGPSLLTLAHHTTTGLSPSSFGELTTQVQSALEAFENLEPARPQSLALHFETVNVSLRWLEGHVLVVIGTQSVNPTVLAVNLNAATSKLQALAAEGGGAARAFRATLSGPAAGEPQDASGIAWRAQSTDQVPDAVISQLTQLYARPLGAMGRLALLQRLKGGKPTLASFADFVRSLASLIGAAPARDEFVRAALELLPSAENAGGASQRPALPKVKRTIVYRGRKLEVDD